MTTVKTAISIDKDLFDEINQLALTMHLSRSQVFSQAAEYMVRKKENLILLDRLNKAYGEAASPEEDAVMKKVKKYHARVARDSWK